MSHPYLFWHIFYSELTFKKVLRRHKYRYPIRKHTGRTIKMTKDFTRTNADPLRFGQATGRLVVIVHGELLASLKIILEGKAKVHGFKGIW
jgi:hypothetical protein